MAVKKPLLLARTCRDATKGTKRPLSIQSRMRGIGERHHADHEHDHREREADAHELIGQHEVRATTAPGKVLDQYREPGHSEQREPGDRPEQLAAALTPESAEPEEQHRPHRDDRDADNADAAPRPSAPTACITRRRLVTHDLEPRGSSGEQIDHPAFWPHQREGDDVADRRLAGERHHQAIHAQAEACGRRHAVLERDDVVLVEVHGLFRAAGSSARPGDGSGSPDRRDR